MTMNIRLIKYLLCGAFLALASCADEELVQTPSGNYKDGDLVTLNFTVSVPRAEEVAMTRAAGDEQEDINEVCVLVFGSTSSSSSAEQIAYVKQDELEDVSTGNGVVRKRFTLQLEAATQDKVIFFVANANDKLREIEDSGKNITQGYVGRNYLDSDENVEYDVESVLAAKHVMCGRVQSPIPGVELLSQDIMLKRSYAQMTVEVSKEVTNFKLEKFYLCHANTTGTLLDGYFGTRGFVSNFTVQTPDPVIDEIQDDSWMKEADGIQYIGPTNEVRGDVDERGELTLLVKGSYLEEGQTAWKTYYYYSRMEITDENYDEVYLYFFSNHHYKVTIKEVNRIGYDNNVEGIKGALTANETSGGMLVEIADIELSSHNMASDGVTEIGVQSDTLWIEGTEQGAKVDFNVTVCPPVTEDNAQIICTWDKEQAPWLEVTQGTTTKESNTQFPDQSEPYDYYSLTGITFSTKTANPAGERREARVGISCRGVMTYVTVIQEPEFCADQFGTVTVKVKECDRNESTWEATNWQWLGGGQAYQYWNFIRGTDGTTDVKGILPDDMGGKVRTEGFHAPMSDFQQFVYTFTVPSGGDYTGCQWHIELDEEYQNKLLFWIGDAPQSAEPRNDGQQITSFDYRNDQQMDGQKFTFTNNLLELQNDGNITEDAYRYGKDAFRIVVTRPDGTEEVYAYDLYHTGVFNYDDGQSNLRVDGQDDAGWYYYEVILMGSNYWLDRNLGATSSAYYVKEGNVGDAAAAGGLYRIANAPSNNAVTLVDEEDWEEIAPKGFRVPTMTEFRALASDSRFCQEMEGSYWGARYDTGKPDQGTVYFPKNGMWYGGSAAGSGSTGYYWTQTEALGASGNEQGYWLQNMQLAGSNASGSRYRICESGTDVNNNPTGMSVRCVYNSRVVETLHKYECYVKGYTHVFLYNDEGNGNRTYLNAWPGDMICINDPNALNMYHTFTFSSMVGYDNLKVVFNVVDNEGKVIETYPDNFQAAGGLDLKEDQSAKFFHKGGTGWTDTADY